MNPGFYKQVQAILATPLPDVNEIVANGRSLATTLQLSRSLFCQKMGVASEAAYKEACKQNGTIMYHAHIGMGSWAATTDALHHLYQHAQAEGFVIDRAGLCLDRRMALPPELRESAPAETGPMLSQQDWPRVGHVVPIQPHMGDFMIGFPAATVNTIQALQAGVTTIGNLSQFFAHEAPLWNDSVKTAVETVRAIAMLGKRHNAGLMLHSYLEDGFGALFFDCVTVAGWAFLERYIVETLLGAKLAHCIGGLTSDPIKRAGWVFALDAIHDKDCLGSMFYGDTISFSHNFPKNWGVVGEYLLWDILAQLECPTGHAVHPLPITEAVRIPSMEEIAKIHTFGRQVEQTARRLHPFVDFGPARAFAEQVVVGGKQVFERALTGLQEAGADVGNPLQLLYLLKQLGPAIFEAEFGLGEWDETAQRRKPLVPTDIFAQSLAAIDTYSPQFSSHAMQTAIGQRRLLLASSDVHEHAVFVLQELLGQAGAEVISLGAEQNPLDVAEAAAQHGVEAILISTHNGMALEYAQRLQAALSELALELPVLMGGILNQKVADEALPVDVTAVLHELGIHTVARLDSGWQKLLA
ncbi:MAG: cobalamin-dependent protein [Chloroflexota bacterium]